MSRTALARTAASTLDASVDLFTAITTACNRIAPIWPLSDFVAVNPFLGLANMSFRDAAILLQRVADARLVMPRSFYAEAIASGRISQSALEESAARIGSAGLTGDALAQAARLADSVSAERKPVIATVAEVIDRVSGQDRRISLAGFMIDEISAFCAAYFDQGQAHWALPTRSLKPFAAWRELAVFDRNPECMGIAGFRSAIQALPSDPVLAIKVIIAGLGIPDHAVVDYLYRALLDIKGWAAYARHFDWPESTAGVPSDTLIGLLAIRLSYGWALFKSRTEPDFQSAWQQAMAEASAFRAAPDADIGREHAVDLALQTAYEISWRQTFIADLTTHAASQPQEEPRPAVQAAFCIDVRSEPFRRALESVDPSVQTIGFAGFFGLPLGIVGPDGATPQGQCPVLLRPSVFLCEAEAGDDPGASLTKGIAKASLKARLTAAWLAFKSSAVSSFTFVEAFGLGLAAKLMSSTAKALGLAHSTEPLRTTSSVSLQSGALNGYQLGMTLDAQVAYAEALFAGMSLKPPFARVLVLVGHTSTTTNNPHARSLDCGACGGHSGEPNVRMAALVLNSAAVQSALRDKGFELPEGWCAVGALHDTVTDRVELCDVDALPRALQPELKRLEAVISAAGALARAGRAKTLGLTDLADLAAFQMRGQDWSQVRPEWGLANNAAFLAGPRALSAGLDLKGRVFLHSYDHRTDRDYSVLESILTAPLIVASWINLQYYASSVDPVTFGSGNKTLHNIVGKLGVYEGNGGDLQIGLPKQSIHDGTDLRHEPIRLQAFVAAPEGPINDIIARHPELKDLLANHWIFLHAIDPVTHAVKLWSSPGTWDRIG